MHASSGHREKINGRKHIENFKSLLSKNGLELASTKPERVQSASLTGAKEMTLIEKKWKQRKEII